MPLNPTQPNRAALWTLHDTTPQVFTLQEKAEEVSTLVVTAAERLAALDKCPFEANSMESALAALQVRFQGLPHTSIGKFLGGGAPWRRFECASSELLSYSRVECRNVSEEGGGVAAPSAFFSPLSSPLFSLLACARGACHCVCVIMMTFFFL